MANDKPKPPPRPRPERPPQGGDPRPDLVRKEVDPATGVGHREEIPPLPPDGVGGGDGRPVPYDPRPEEPRPEHPVPPNPQER